MRRGVVVAAIAALLPASVPARSEEPADPRGDLEALAAVLESAVARVSRPSAAPFLGGAEACRGYRLRGYGAVIVVPPRALPQRGNVLVFGGHAAPGTIVHWSQGAPAPVAPGESVEDTLAELQAQQRLIESEIQSQQDGRKRTREARQRELKAIEAKVEALQREAERTRQEAERALEQAVREVQFSLTPMPPTAPAPETPVAAPAPETPTAPVSPATAPTPPVAPRPPVMPAPPSPPAPPWRFWFNTGDDDDPRPAEKVVSDVRSVVTQVLESQGASLKAVRSDEFVTVAVDFVPQWGFFDEGARPEKTLIVRVRKKELEDRAAGKLPAEEFRKRIEYVEY
jgi:hypothetical protein